jgi:hypothetical protein
VLVGHADAQDGGVILPCNFGGEPKLVVLFCHFLPSKKLGKWPEKGRFSIAHPPVFWYAMNGSSIANHPASGPATPYKLPGLFLFCRAAAVMSMFLSFFTREIISIFP